MVIGMLARFSSQSSRVTSVAPSEIAVAAINASYFR
jgi:exopolysaccharide biosynthesis protein